MTAEHEEEIRGIIKRLEQLENEIGGYDAARMSEASIISRIAVGDSLEADDAASREPQK